jgi:YD repeat-containing protein
VSITDARTGVSRTEYDAVGNIVQVTDRRGGVTALCLRPGSTAARRRPTRWAKRRRGPTTQWATSSRRRTDLGRVTRYEYDAQDHLVRLTRPDAGGGAPVVTYAYDAVGKRVATTDELGRTSTLTYDALDRPVQSTDALGHTTGEQHLRRRRPRRLGVGRARACHDVSRTTGSTA